MNQVETGRESDLGTPQTAQTRVLYTRAGHRIRTVNVGTKMQSDDRRVAPVRHCAQSSTIGNNRSPWTPDNVPISRRSVGFGFIGRTSHNGGAANMRTASRRRRAWASSGHKSSMLAQ